MRILQIRFKNINNLKGEHAPVSFNEEPLKSAGIFAITGPTGSGKSTLLDVITLALFNRVPRYKSKITRKEIDDLGSIMTHHTNDAYAAIDFEIKGNRFTSEWKVSKNSKGKLNDYEMFIYDAAGTPLDLKKKDVPAYNENLIGLKYDQFVKSIILSQGQFSKFLKADENERGQLLENLTGTGIYRKIGRKIYEKNKEIKSQVELEKKVLENLTTLSDEEVKFLTEEVKTATEKITRLDKEIKGIAEASQLKKEMNSLQASLLASEIESKNLALRVQQFDADAKRLSLHNKLNPVREDIALYKDAKSNATLTTKNLNEYKEQHEQSKVRYQKSIDDMAALTKEKVTKDNFHTTMRVFENEVNALNQELNNNKKKGKEIRDRINKIKENYPTSISPKPSEAIAAIRGNIASLQLTIEKSQLTTDSNLVDARKQLKSQKKNYDDLLLIKHEYDHILEAQTKIEETKKKIQAYTTEKEKHEPTKKKIEELIYSYKSLLVTLEKRKEDAIRIASLEAHRQSLVDGEACPLCGSLEHPYTQHLPESDKLDIENKILKTKQDILHQEKELNQINEALTKAYTSLKLTQEELLGYEKQLSTSQTTLKQKLKDQKNNKASAPETITKEIATLDEENKLLENSIHALDELKIASQLLEAFEALNKAIETNNELTKKRNAKFEGENIGDITNKLQDDFQEHGTSLTRLQEAIAKETKDSGRAIESVKLHQRNLQPKLEKLGFNSIEEMSQHFLSESEEKTMLQESETIKKLQTENLTKISSDKIKLAALTAKDLLPNAVFDELIAQQKTLETERNALAELIGEKRNQINADQETKKNQKTKLVALENLNKELEKWSLLNKMIGDLNGNKFANFSQGLTLQNLLVYANKRLTNLTDRYLLDKPKDGGALQVVDQFQGNIHRAVSTLSGGESFLISLALALSLSDMASRNVSLESLFIDEGFGTLDQETLDIAMNTLEKLQSESQKTVGVISHVEALKERINVQIKLEKNAQGYSTIKIGQY